MINQTNAQNPNQDIKAVIKAVNRELYTDVLLFNMKTVIKIAAFIGAFFAASFYAVSLSTCGAPLMLTLAYPLFRKLENNLVRSFLETQQKIIYSKLHKIAPAEGKIGQLGHINREKLLKELNFQSPQRDFEGFVPFTLRAMNFVYSEGMQKGWFGPKEVKYLTIN